MRKNKRHGWSKRGFGTVQMFAILLVTITSLFFVVVMLFQSGAKDSVEEKSVNDLESTYAKVVLENFLNLPMNGTMPDELKHIPEPTVADFIAVMQKEYTAPADGDDVSTDGEASQPGTVVEKRDDVKQLEMMVEWWIGSLKKFYPDNSIPYVFETDKVKIDGGALFLKCPDTAYRAQYTIPTESGQTTVSLKMCRA